MDTAKYHPVCLLSHRGKSIGTAILSILNEQFRPAKSQFRFQERISMTQASLQAQENAGSWMKHVAVLDLEKSCDKIDRQLLLHVMHEVIDDETKKMVRALLASVRIHTRGDLTNCTAGLVRVVTQRAPSSPVPLTFTFIS